MIIHVSIAYLLLLQKSNDTHEFCFGSGSATSRQMNLFYINTKSCRRIVMKLECSMKLYKIIIRVYIMRLSQCIQVKFPFANLLFC